MKKILSILLVTIPSLVFANTVSNKSISKAHVNISSGYYFQTVEKMVDPDGCGKNGWYKLKDSTFSKEAFSLVLAAKMSERKVTFNLSGCSSGYPRVSWINVHE